MAKIGDAISKSIILLLRAYQYFLSPWLGYRCRFYPSCSHYAINAIHQWRLLKGCSLALRRCLRCHPWHRGGYDPVPEKLCQHN